MSRSRTFSWQERESQIRNQFRSERDPSIVLRLHTLGLLRSGQRTERHVAEVLSVHVGTVETWVQGYRQEGLARVCQTKPRVGARPKLSVNPQHALRVHVQEPPAKTAHEMRAWVEQEWTITYHPKAWYVTVHRLGLRTNVPRPRSDTASDEAQEAWKKRVCRNDCVHDFSRAVGDES